MMLKHFLILSVLVTLLSCDSKSDTEAEFLSSIPVNISWYLDSINMNPNQISYVTFLIENQSGQELTSTNWSLHFNQLGGAPIMKSFPTEISVVNQTGDYFILKPMALWQPLANGSSMKISFSMAGILDKFSESPKGIFVVIDGKAFNIPNAKTQGINTTILAKNNPYTNEDRYMDYSKLKELPKEQLLPFIPSPSIFNKNSGKYSIDKNISIGGSLDAPTAIAALKRHSQILNIAVTKSEDSATIILEPSNSISSEGYIMDINESGITIKASDDKGAFYAIQSLSQMLIIAQIENNGKIELNYSHIEDVPRFGYRGMHLDVVRSFHSKEAVKKVLDQMAFFKLNKFQFHITDDEGWRIEIPELPELTTIGAKRGYTLDEREHLFPSYGSGANPETSYGSGFYTQADYIEIIQYAHERNIEVIPEIDVPGHARAAIKAMTVRHDRLMTEGKTAEAKRYLLNDSEDASKYTSAQGYSDNVVCVCQEGAYNFMELVLEAIVDLHKEANVPLNTIHVGGDEIPHGVWTDSPVCDAFINSNPALNKPADLQVYFFNKLKAVLNKHNLIMGGWEEVLLAHDEKGHNTTDINYDMIDDQTLAYVWNSKWGWGREDMVYKLANAGAKVIMCNSSAYYFDMAYDQNPDEIGLSWSGYSNTKTIYSTDPLNIFKLANLDLNLAPIDLSNIASKASLTSTGKTNLLGIQAQLWSETVNKEEYIEYLMFPKVFGFAERAWSSEGSWMNLQKSKKVDAQFDESWNVFANTVGQRGLPMIMKAFDGVNYREPQIGISKEGKRNIQFPGYVDR
ncbi:MAG: hexosaminidase [Saprospiraceae bacterium]|jgi:hexosaminidase